MGKKSAPEAPDPVTTAMAQGQVNREAAYDQANLNMVDQFTPYGNLEYNKIFDQEGFDAKTASQAELQRAQVARYGSSYAGYNAPDKEKFTRFSATQTLSPENQRMLDLTNQAGIKFGETANAQLGQVSDKLSQPLDFSGLGDAPVANEETRRASSQAIMDRLKPQWDQDRSRLETMMANRGFGMGSEAWNRGMDDFNRGQTDARLAADSYGGSEMERMFGLELTGRNQGINEMVQQRQIPLNELNAMLSGSQVQQPGFVNAPQGQINPADLTGATYASYQGEMDAYRQNQATQNAMMGGLFGLGSAGIGYAGMSKLAGAGAGAGSGFNVGGFLTR